MCKASQEAKRSEGMNKGERYGIATAPGGLAAFSKYGQPVAECVACAQTGAVLTLMNIPLELQQQYQLKAREVVLFQQTGHNMQDQLTLKDGRQLSLSVFANKNVGVFFGEIEELASVDGDGGVLVIEGDSGLDIKAEGDNGLDIDGVGPSAMERELTRV